MSQVSDPQIRELQSMAGEVAALLKQMANPRRLLILCHLAEGEATVSDLCAIAGLSPSAMSQHLAKLRAEGLVQSEKDGLQVRYALTDQRCIDLLHHLKRSFCEPAPAAPAQS